MSRFGANRGKKLPGSEFSWDTEAGGEPDNAPTPLFPVSYDELLSLPLLQLSRF